MDGNDHSHTPHGFFGQVINDFVRNVLSQHNHNPHAADAASAPPQPTEVHDPPPSYMTSTQQETVQPDAVRPEGVEAPSAAPSITSDPALTSATVAAPESSIASSSGQSSANHPSSHHESLPDVEMSDARASASAESSSRPQPASRNTRRARVEDEGDDDYWRESNRQRMHSPTPYEDDHHHFMQIPEDHGVPQLNSSAGIPPQAPPPPTTAEARPGAPQDDRPHRMLWTFDFLPAPSHNHDNAQAGDRGNTQHPPSDRRGEARHEHDHGRGHHDHMPTLNFFINVPMPNPTGPTGPAAANANGNAAPVFTFRPYLYPTFIDGGAAPGNAGFAFPPFPFPFAPVGVDMVEERDDPERAQRLVEGLEEVPAGLVKRMERVGGPGTAKGETPTCAVCWESLLEPEGGGFEGNAELAKAEAAQAAREDTASQQGHEGLTNVEGPTAASQGQSSPLDASSSAAPSTPSGEESHPKIVVLPCSHVFHASCLLPWFSKPGRTTCPSCRFDIDPDSLTYTPRPLRARRPARPAAPQPQQPPVFGPAPPPSNAAAPPPSDPAAAVPLGSTNAPNAVHSQADAQPQPHDPAGQPAQQQQHPPLPPFITFDISMIIPVFPGRPAGSAQPTNGAQATNLAGDAAPQGAVPPPPRTDHNGFRLDDPILAQAVRDTFERIFGRPAPQAHAEPLQPQAAGGATPGENAARDVPLDWYTFAGPLPGFPPVPPPNARRASSQRPAPKRKWTLPPPPGPTLRQLVERNEREMGLRCSDVSCGLGPSDDDPTSMFDATALRQISIRPLKGDGSGKDAVCEHKFHPSCLVSAERVAGWGGEDKKEERENEGEDVEVSCPVCRAVGVISRLDWEEGACTLA